VILCVVGAWIRAVNAPAKARWASADDMWVYLGKRIRQQRDINGIAGRGIAAFSLSVTGMYGGTPSG